MSSPSKVSFLRDRWIGKRTLSLEASSHIVLVYESTSQHGDPASSIERAMWEADVITLRVPMLEAPEHALNDSRAYAYHLRALFPFVSRVTCVADSLPSVVHGYRTLLRITNLISSGSFAERQV